MSPRVAVLLSTFNGEPYLAEQLASLLAQTHADWTLYWRDDGSSDGTLAVIAEFAAGPGAGRCVHIAGPPGRVRPTASFLALLRAVAPTLGAADVIAFADQDDVWLPDKLRRGVAVLAAGGASGPMLYCARQMLVDAALRPLRVSVAVARAATFPASLTQNLATGCTIMLNRSAARLVAGSEPSPASLHDWWCNLMVTAGGGQVVVDDTPVVLYRQHGANMVGAAPPPLRRALAALRRGPGAFMNTLRQNVAALAAQRHLLAEPAATQVIAIHNALHGGWRERLAALALPGFHRQTWPQTLLFRFWFLIG